MTNHMTVTAIMPVFNRIQETIPCLERLQRLTTDTVSVKVVLVDDGSTDGTPDTVQTRFPKVIVLRGDGNLWWAGGVNKGFEYIRQSDTPCDYILILNNDTVFDRNTFEILLNTAKERNKTVCSPIVIDEESGRIYNAGQRRTGFFQDLKPVGKGDVHRKRGIIQVDSVGSRFVLMPARILDDVGMFDAFRFPHGHSDFEYFLRARLLGYDIVIHTDSVISTRQNRNYINRRLIDQNVRELLSAYTDKKFENNIRLVFFRSFSHKPFLIGLMTLIKSIANEIRWLAYKILLPPEKLEQIVNRKWII